MDRLDAHDKMPEAMVNYLSNNGWHFSKKMCEWAISKMRGANDAKIEPITKDKLDALMKQYKIELKNDKGYDAVYVANMAKADFCGRSLPSDQYLCMYVKDYIDDPDGYEGLPFTRFYADCIGSGTPIIWDDLL